MSSFLRFLALLLLFFYFLIGHVTFSERFSSSLTEVPWNTNILKLNIMLLSHYNTRITFDELSTTILVYKWTKGSLNDNLTFSYTFSSLTRTRPAHLKVPEPSASKFPTATHLSVFHPELMCTVRPRHISEVQSLLPTTKGVGHWPRQWGTQENNHLVMFIIYRKMYRKTICKE